MKEKPRTYERTYPFGSEWFVLQQVGRVTAIREPYHFEDVLSFFIQGDNEAVLIDTGMGLANIASVISSPVTVMLTHTHWDHMGCVGEFDNVVVSEVDFEKDRLTKGWLPHEMDGFEERFFSKPLPSQFNPKEFSIKGLSDFDTLVDGETIDIGGEIIHVIHTPGHTPGSLCFFMERNGYLVTGDTLYPGPEYIHLPESSYDNYKTSLNKLFEDYYSRLKGIFPGHNAYFAPRELLRNHILAVNGDLTVVGEVRGEDFFGRFVERKYEDFSIMVRDDKIP